MKHLNIINKKKTLIVLVSIPLAVVFFYKVYVFYLNRSDVHQVLNCIENNDTKGLDELFQKMPNLVNARSMLRSDTLLNIAVNNCDTNIVRVFLKNNVDLSLRGLSRRTALHVAVAKKNIEVVRLLIKSGADVNAIGGRHNSTPLHIAAAKGLIGIAKILIQNGANLNATNSIQKKPLDLAKEINDAKMVAILSTPLFEKIGR